MLYPAELRARGVPRERQARDIGGGLDARNPRLRAFSLFASDQPLRTAVPQIDAAQALARSAKSAANLLCHARAVSVTARCAAIRSSTALRL